MLRFKQYAVFVMFCLLAKVLHAGICPKCRQESYFDGNCLHADCILHRAGGLALEYVCDFLPELDSGKKGARIQLLEAGAGLSQLASPFIPRIAIEPKPQQVVACATPVIQVPEWISLKGQYCPRRSEDDDPEISIPILSEELSKAQNRDGGYQLLEPSEGQGAIDLLRQYLTHYGNQYLIQYQFSGTLVEHEEGQQIFMVEISNNGRVFVLSDVYGLCDEVEPLESADEFIELVLGNKFDPAQETLTLYQHIPGASVPEDDDPDLTPTGPGSQTPTREDMKTPVDREDMSTPTEEN